MKIHKIYNLKVNRIPIFSFTEHVETIYDYYRNHLSLQKVSSNIIGYYDNIGRKRSFIQTMRYAGNFKNPMNYCSRNYKSFSDIIEKYYE